MPELEFCPWCGSNRLFLGVYSYPHGVNFNEILNYKENVTIEVQCDECVDGFFYYNKSTGKTTMRKI